MRPTSLSMVVHRFHKGVRGQYFMTKSVQSAQSEQSVSSAQSLRFGRSLQPGQSVAQLKNQLETLMKRAIDDGEAGGMNLLLVQHGRPVVFAAEGTARADGTPYCRDTILRLYSQSKPITATAVMILVERGLLDLDAPLSSIFPEFADQRVCVAHDASITSDLPEEDADHAAAALKKAGADKENLDSALMRGTEPVRSPLTIRNLLTMTSGLTYPSSDSLAGQGSGAVYADLGKRLNTSDEMTTREFARRFASVPLHFQPGSHWEYGTSADILGAVVEAVSGQRFGDFLAQNIFEPLGMHDTGFWVPASKRDRLADIWDDPIHPFEPSHKGVLKFTRTNHLGINYTADHEPAFQSGGAGLSSTLDDYAHFGCMLLGHGTFDGTRILSPATVDYMTHDAITAQEHAEFEQWQSGCGYNCLMRIVRDPSRTHHLAFTGDYGWDGWLGTYFKNMPTQDAVLVLGVQQANTGTTGVTRRLRNVVSAYLSCE